MIFAAVVDRGNPGQESRFSGSMTRKETVFLELLVSDWVQGALCLPSWHRRCFCKSEFVE
jgi:hypothetical protein